MKIFVSYTCLDGLITKEVLESLNNYLSEICDPFIHLLKKPHLRWQQASVVFALFFSDITLLIESPKIYQSRWVRFELNFSKFLCHPIIHMDIHDVFKLSKK